MEKRVVICLNKGDWYDAQERQALMDQIHRQVANGVDAEDIVAVRSQITQRPRVRVLSDGTQAEELVEVPIDIGPLADRMMKIVKRDGRDLLLGNL